MSEEKLIRLGQASRKLNVGHNAILDFLAKRGFQIENNPNAKLTPEQFSLIVKEFGLQSQHKVIQPSKNETATKSNVKRPHNIKVVGKIDLGNQVASLESKRKRINETTSKKTNQKGETVVGTIKLVIPPSQIVIQLDESAIARLSICNMSWSFPEAEAEFKKLKEGDQIECIILERNDGQIIVSKKHLHPPLHHSMMWQRIERGDESKAVVIEHLLDNYVVKTETGLYGILNKELPGIELSNIKVKVNSKLEVPNLIQFVPASMEIEKDGEVGVDYNSTISFIDNELQSFQKFKRSLVGRSATDSQCEIIQNGFNLDPNIFSKALTTKYILYIQFEYNSWAYDSIFKNQAIPYFTTDASYSKEAERLALEKLSKLHFWFRLNRRANKGEQAKESLADIIEISLFNEEISILCDVRISKDQKEYKYLIKNLIFGQTVSGASNSNKRSAKEGSFLFANQLKILSPLDNLPFGSSQKDFFQLASIKTECFNIVKLLRQEAGEILRQEGRTLAIIDKSLEYQISQIEGQKENNVHINEYTRIPSKTGGVSITIDEAAANSLELDEDLVVNVRLKKGDDLMKLTEGVVSMKEKLCRVTFYKEFNLELLNSGFYVDKKIPKNQLKVQRDIIKDFLEKKIDIDHIESLLVNPQRVKTPIVKNVKFIDPNLARAEQEEPDNTQVLAVKKAIGNENIFLIQGPPGTGKTTVIAEIIQQLVAQGEKILVAGQNHVAVDNVLRKMAKLPWLNLLRVGNPDKIASDLVRYNIENLIEDFTPDYQSFLSHQVELAKFYLTELQNGTQGSDLIDVYNAKVNEVCARYINLQEIYKQRHFVLRDALSQLMIDEIQSAIESLNLWIQSNSDYEILLKPLIYGSVDVVFSTCIGIKGDRVFKDSNFRFDTVIIDEAGKANIAESLVAIELGRKVILVGDQMQLPPYIESNLIDENDPLGFPKSTFGSDFLIDEIKNALTASFFEFIINRIEVGQFPSDNKIMLNYQHRMHPNIGLFVSESFYEGTVKMGKRTSLNKIEMPSPFDKEVIFFDTSNTPNPYEQSDGYSVKNNTEAQAIAEIILPELFSHNVTPSQVAVIAPYKSQVANIQLHINNSDSCNFKNIDISSLDSFQGREYDIIIFSFTRCSHTKKVGFLDDARRLNVAFSRAKSKLILVGNESTLTNPKSHFDFLFDYTALFKRLVSLSKNESIGRFVNIADYSSFKSPFSAFNENFKPGDTFVGEIGEHIISKKSGNKIGVNVRYGGCSHFAPYYFQDRVLNRDFAKYELHQPVACCVIEIQPQFKSSVIRLFDFDWFKAVEFAKTNNCDAEIIATYPHGYLVKTAAGVVGLLNIKQRNYRRHKEGDTLKVRVSSSDFINNKIKFKLA